LPTEDQTEGWATARVATVIGAPLDSVFKFVCDPSNDPLWMPKLGPGKQITAGPVGCGTRFRQSVILLGGQTDVEWEITEFIPNRRAAGKSIAGPITYNGFYEFDRTESSTLLTKFGAISLRGIFSFIPVNVANGLLLDEFQNAFERLKRLLERGK
jgi:hypothetical protein